MTLAEQQGLVQKGQSPGALQMAVVFTDLSSFTPLAEAMGDMKAAAVLERFSTIVRQAVGTWTGRVVKQIGDAFMLVFPEARSAVACALEIESRAAKELQFPAVRAGIQWGTVLYREGDYVGSNVNVASRIANEAQRHQVLVTAEVRKEARDLPEIEFVRLGKRQLKGLSVKVDLFEVRSSVAAATEKAIDPVCGMELGAEEIAARLSLEGAERAFCSEACLRKFVASPEAYT
jgi:adenylate cyclase